MGKLFDTEKEKLIAVCIAGIDEYTQTGYIDTLTELVDKVGYKVIFFTTFSSTCMSDHFLDGEMNIFSLINYRLLDGLVIFAETIKDGAVVHTIVTSANAAGVPVISVDHPMDGCYNIVFDYKGAMERLVRHMAQEHSFRRIEYIGGIPGNPASQERLDVFHKVMEENGRTVAPSQIHYGYFWSGPTEKVMDEILSRPRQEMPDAVVCANDAMALVVCKKLRDAGLRVPEDVAVTGFDGIQEASYHSPKLTTAKMEAEVVSTKIFEIFTALFTCGQTEKTHLLPFTMIFSESSGCYSASDDTTKNTIVQALYTKIDENHFMTNRMVMMMAELSACSTVADVRGCLKAFIPNMVAWKSWLCIVDDYLKDCPKVEDIVNHTEQKNGYTRRMNCMLRRDGWEYEENIEFSKDEILPDLKKDLQLCGKILIVPLHVLEKTIGYFAVSYATGMIEFHQMQNFVNTLSSELAAVKVRLEQKTMVEKFKNQSIHDALTGILNRRGFFEKLKGSYGNSMESGRKFALISLDMDGLKYINDNFGHGEGDVAIRFTADALTRVCGVEFFCARTGGDEFMAAGVVGEEAAKTFEERLQKEFDGYNAATGHLYRVGFSMGMMYDNVAQGLPAAEFIRMADERMYIQKAEHRKRKEYQGRSQ